MTEDFSGYTRAELAAKRSAALASSRLVTGMLAALAVGIMIFNAGMGTPFLMRLGAAPEIAWLGPLIADAGMVITLVGTKYLHGEGASSSALMCGVWGTAVMSCVLTAGGSLWPAAGGPKVVAAVVFGSFPLLLVVMAHGAAAVQRHAGSRAAAFDAAARTAPKKAASAAPQATATADRTPAEPKPQPAPQTPASEPTARPDRATVLADMTTTARAGGSLPTATVLAQRTGYSQRWAETVLAEARKAARKPHLVEATQ